MEMGSWIGYSKEKAGGGLTGSDYPQWGGGSIQYYLPRILCSSK